LREIGVRGSEATTGIVDLIRSIEGVEVAILLREDKGKIRINFRAKSNISVGEIARHFGGGGHDKAAGAVVTGELADVAQDVVAEAVKYERRNYCQ
jgi:phosphoesterase RecJ-like protein